MEFMDYLSTMRKSKKMTVRKFASDIGISPSFLCDLESGNRSFPSDSKVSPGLLGRIISTLDLNEVEAEEIRILEDQSML